MHQLLFLEFIGTSELMVVLVVALIIFGPRKLPELGRSLG
ncbi:MAG: twin-arginine translocase TatA/TatE family subunit, partial [Pyrinomonadaceae bacterium]